MGRSPGFGSTPANFRPFQTRFRFGSVVLTLLANVTRRSVLQKVRHYSLMELWLIVSMRFQVLFTPLPGFFSPFPHGTSSLSVAKEYLALRGGPRSFPRNSTCFVVLWIHSAWSGFRLRGSNLLWLAFPCHSANLYLRDECPNPSPRAGLGSSLFARRYWGNRVFFLFL